MTANCYNILTLVAVCSDYYSFQPFALLATDIQTAVPLGRLFLIQQLCIVKLLLIQLLVVGSQLFHGCYFSTTQQKWFQQLS